MAFGKLNNVLKYKDISNCLKKKKKVYDQCILPVFTYGIETWILRKHVVKKLATMQRVQERVMTSIKMLYRKDNTCIPQQSKQQDVVKSKWNWAGHVGRINDK